MNLQNTPTNCFFCSVSVHSLWANLNPGGVMTKKKSVNLSVGRGEKLPVSKGAGLTAKGRAKYNRATGSDLKAPQPQGGPRKRSFCARMSGMKGPMKDEKGRPTRKAASLKRWGC